MNRKDLLSFIKDFFILTAYILSAFFIIITGVLLVPSLIKIDGDASLLLYLLGMFSFAVILIYSGMKKIGSFVKIKKEITKAQKEVINK
jgi:hypothetical protein